MRNIFLAFTLLLANIYIALIAQPIRQDISPKKRAEIEAVKNYMQNYFQNYAPASKLSKTTAGPSNIDKYAEYEKFLKSQSIPVPPLDKRKSVIMNGNQIQVGITNYGGIGEGYGAVREISGLVWKKVPYIFQFSPVIGASVKDPDNPNRRFRIFTDGLWDYPNYRTVNPTGDTLWQWEPLAGYADPNQTKLAVNPDFDTDGDGKPDSWPREWYNPTLGQYVWPGFLKQGATNADMETIWAMDDRNNRRYEYYPYKDDRTRKGIGIKIEGRAFQWANAQAENVLFVVYTITNISDYDIDTVVFGIYGDPDVGGTSGAANQKNLGFFVPPINVEGYPPVDNIPVYARSIAYFWTTVSQLPGGLKTGYLGCKFLESPGNSYDGIDNDGDGMIDESQENGIDDDGDWNPETDDVGIDGIPATGDEGEGDGIPTAGRRLPDGSLDPLFPGEPNFELTDLDEADQIGLTSFSTWRWATDKISNHESMWIRMTPGNFEQIESEPQDIVFIFGSGYITPLRKGETKRISMAFICGETLDDVLITAETVQRIYNENYNFYRPPDLPTLVAVPGDRKVTLYWDDVAEHSVDKFTGKDFQGYVLYRSEDPNFTDIQVITDGKGTPYLYKPHTNIYGAECKWDLVDEWKGYHPISYSGRGVRYYLGNNTGLAHFYVDSNNVVNGKTYYYALCAYDRGDSTNYPPAETSKKITVDPISGKIITDKNTAVVVPGPRAGGYEPPTIALNENLFKYGYGSGKYEFKVLDDRHVVDNEYRLVFSMTYKNPDNTTIQRKNYSVIDEKVYNLKTTLYQDKYSKIGKENIIFDQNFKVSSSSGVIYEKDIDYEVNFAKGIIRRTSNSRIQDGETVTVTFKYYPIYQSLSLNFEDNNPVFDGIKVKIKDEPNLEWDQEQSKWLYGRSNLVAATVNLSSIGAQNRKMLYPADYEIEFSDTQIDSAVRFQGTQRIVFPVNYSVKEITSGIPQRMWTLLKKGTGNNNLTQWQPGDEIIIFKPGSRGTNQDTLTWGVVFNLALNATQPVFNDKYILRTKRPYTEQDYFVLKTSAGSISKEKAKKALDNVYVVPNPYIAFSEIEPQNRIPGQNRGERRIYFENLPPKCVIKIYTLNGELVKTINHDSNTESGRAYWNLLNKDGFSVAYGLYLAHIEAPGIGEKIIKFAIIK